MSTIAEATNILKEIYGELNNHHPSCDSSPIAMAFSRATGESLSVSAATQAEKNILPTLAR
jgi:hypothetical protein